MRSAGMTQEELAAKMGKSQSTIANKMRILKLPLTVKRMLLQYNLTERHARALLRLHDEEMQIKIVNVIVQQNLNVKATEDLVERTLSRMYGIEAEEPTKTGKISGFVRDTRLFVNSIKTVVRQMSDAGLAPKFDSSESDGGLEIRVWIPQNKVFLFSLGCAIIEHRSPASVCYLPLIRQFLSRILKILIRN